MTNTEDMDNTATKLRLAQKIKIRPQPKLWTRLKIY